MTDAPTSAERERPGDGAGPPDVDIKAIEELGEAYGRIRSEIGRAIVGQEQVIEELLIAIFSRGHCILEGVPGLAKTLMISTLARTLSLSFNRIQFTPDLMPSDITGTEVIQENRTSGDREMRFIPGPVFATIVLADEINRTPPKTQAAMLEAMQERQVTTGGTRRPLEAPFFVLATQNPIEQEGTYPLPEAQLDRFMFKVFVDYPDEDEEFEILKVTTAAAEPEINSVLGGAEINDLQEIVRRVPAADHVIRYAMGIARATRVTSEDVPDFIRKWVAWGAGPRAGQYLVLGGKARSILHGRPYVSTEDIRAVAKPVLRHRIITNFNAEAEGVRTDRIIEMLIDAIPATESEGLADARVPEVFRS